MSVQTPNKIYLFEYKGETSLFSHSHFVVVVAACDRETAKAHVKEQVGIDAEPIWLMNATYPTIYLSNGVTSPTQAKILSNNHMHITKEGKMY